MSHIRTETKLTDGQRRNCFFYDEPPPPPHRVNPETRRDFLYVVQTLLLVHETRVAKDGFQRQTSFDLTLVMGQALFQSEYLPRRNGIAFAAADFLSHFVQGFQEAPDAEPAEWLCLPTDAFRQWVERHSAREARRNELGKSRQSTAAAEAADPPPPRYGIEGTEPPREYAAIKPDTEMDAAIKAYLRNARGAGKAKIVRRFPQWTERQITRQLQKLKDYDDVRVEGTGRGARWYVNL